MPNDATQSQPLTETHTETQTEEATDNVQNTTDNQTQNADVTAVNAGAPAVVVPAVGVPAVPAANDAVVGAARLSGPPANDRLPVLMFDGDDAHDRLDDFWTNDGDSLGPLLDFTTHLRIRRLPLAVRRDFRAVVRAGLDQLDPRLRRPYERYLRWGSVRRVARYFHISNSRAASRIDDANYIVARTILEWLDQVERPGRAG